MKDNTVHVWAFVSTDANETDARYAGCVSLFWRKGDALRCMRRQVRDDVECGLFARRDLAWNESRTTCADRGGRMTYKVERLEVGCN